MAGGAVNGAAEYSVRGVTVASGARPARDVHIALPFWKNLPTIRLPYVQ